MPADAASLRKYAEDGVALARAVESRKDLQDAIESQDDLLRLNIGSALRTDATSLLADFRSRDGLVMQAVEAMRTASARVVALLAHHDYPALPTITTPTDGADADAAEQSRTVQIGAEFHRRPPATSVNLTAGAVENQLPQT